MKRVVFVLWLLACSALTLAQAPSGLSAHRLVRLDTAMERYVADEAVAGPWVAGQGTASGDDARHDFSHRLADQGAHQPLVPNSTDIRTRWPTLVFQALTDTR